MDVVIRIAVSDDVKDVAALNTQVQQMHEHYYPDYFRHPSVEETAQEFISFMGDPDTKILVAIHDGRLVGYAMFMHIRRPSNTFCRSREWLEIDQMSVLEEYRRRGIGRRLVERIVDHAETLGIHQVELSSWSFNQDAHTAFEKMGFKPRIVRFRLDSQ